MEILRVVLLDGLVVLVVVVELLDLVQRAVENLEIVKFPPLQLEQYQFQLKDRLVLPETFLGLVVLLLVEVVAVLVVMVFKRALVVLVKKHRLFQIQPQ